MKSEPKPFASLSSGLLARKGAARPAMKPQGFGQIGGGNLEDLGWNDMGFEPPKPAAGPRDEEHDAFGEELPEQPIRNPIAALTPIGSPVHDQQAELADHFGAAEEGEDEETDETDETDETAEIYEGDPEPAEVVRTPDPAPKAAATRRQPKPRSAPGANGKAAFTLRLDQARHLKLRLACAVTGRSAQQLVTDALDQLLAEMPELDSMAERAPTARKRAAN